jgi:hypothetical protein
MPAISRRSIHCSDNGSRGRAGFGGNDDTDSGICVKQRLQLLPRALCLIAEKYDLALPFVEIKGQARLYLAFGGTKVRAGNVIDVNKKRPTLRMGELDEFHLITSNRRIAKGSLTAGNSG